MIQGESPSNAHATIDLETRSACSLKQCGAWRYSVDPSTEVLCLAFRLPHWKKSRIGLWYPAFPHLAIPESQDPSFTELIDWISEGGLLEAHNVWFEFCIWTNILEPQFGFPSIAFSQWRCSAAKTATFALPRQLDQAAAALHLPVRKDKAGHTLMMKVSKPRKPRKAEREAGNLPQHLWHESRVLFEKLWAYCRQDILVEDAISSVLDDLNPLETQIFELDRQINLRGFQIDKEGVETALCLIAHETSQLNQELTTLTKGAVTKASQRAKLLDWLIDEGVDLLDTQAKTIEAFLTPEYAQFHHLSQPAQRALELLQILGRSSITKYQAMDRWMDPHDARIRGGLLYHGATTGRWSGAGVQPHNFVRGRIKDIDGLWSALKTGQPVRDNKGVQLHTLDALSQALRGAIIAGPGKQLYAADYAAIEARVVTWLAGDEDALDIFRRGEDIYLDMAEAIYGYPCTKDDHPKERSIGKIAILGLGYQMGWAKFQATCENGGNPISEEFAQQVVQAYREKYWRIKQFWEDIEHAAIRAIYTKTPQHCGKVCWIPTQRFLFCQLPSKRRLAYPEPQLQNRTTSWGAIKEAVTYMGFNTYTHKWERQHTYGGMLVENITQAVARDLMAAAMLRCEASGVYELVLSVHDELVAEADLGKGSVKEFEALMAQCPPWATDCPIVAEGWTGFRYHK